ncbi:hypothetical protein D3C76_270920 [compost metagenome]
MVWCRMVCWSGRRVGVVQNAALEQVASWRVVECCARADGELEWCRMLRWSKWRVGMVQNAALEW